MNPTTIRVNHFRAPVPDVIVHQPLTPSLGYSLAEPERFMDRIGGYRACGYGWTDGIQEHATWFVEPVATTTVRIDYSMVTFGPLAREGVTPREEGANLLARLEWRVLQA